MNKHILFSFIFCTIAPLQGMEQTPQALVLPDWKSAQEALRTDYRNYLARELEHYKTDYVLNVPSLISMAHTIQGIEAKTYYPDNAIAEDILSAKDNQGNYFIHIAIEKKHNGAVSQLGNIRSRAVLARNNANQTPLDLCISKMSHDMDNTIMNAILETLLYKTAHLSLSHIENQKFMEASLNAAILLQLGYKKQGKELEIKTEHLMRLVNFKIKQEEQTAEKTIELLSSFYQQAADEDGDTFTHVLVKQELADELFRWIQQERVSFAKNNAQLTPLDSALAQFRHFTQNVTLIGENKESFEKRRCCFFMLFNYLKMKSGQSVKDGCKNCCDKHSIVQ